MLRRLLTLAFAVLALVALTWSLQGLEERAGAAIKAGVEPRYTAKQAEWTHLGAQGVAEFHLSADTVEFYDDRSATLHNVVMDRFHAGQSPWRLTAPQGSIPAQESRVLLQNPVNITGTLLSGETLAIKTPRLWADSTRNELYTDADVQISSLNWQATATGMRTDLAGDKVTLLHNSKVNYVPHP